MQKEIAKLKREIGRAPRNERGRRRYGRDLRERVIDLATRWRADGHAVAALARELGVRDSMLAEWLRSAGARRVRRVEVVDEPSSPAGRLIIRLPNGAVIEGLSLEDVASLLRTGA
jgi:transposase-like protein